MYHNVYFACVCLVLILPQKFTNAIKLSIPMKIFLVPLTKPVEKNVDPFEDANKGIVIKADF